MSMETLIEKYSIGLEQLISTSADPLPAKNIVFITGSTGNLGSEMLSRLLEEKEVEKVFAFNRATPSSSTRGSLKERQEKQFRDHGISASLLSTSIENGKLVYLEGDASQDLLGLTTEQYELVSTIFRER